MAGFHGAVLFFLGTLLWYEVIKRLDLARATAIITPAEPIASLLLVWLLLGSTPNLLQWIGLLLVAPGMWFVVTRSGFDESKPHVTDAIGSSAVPIEASMPAGKDTDSGR
jgi:drug/metabolite transporter (DMT)-like permease